MPNQSTTLRSSVLAIEYLDVASIRTDPRNVRRHSKAQLMRLQAGITEFGFSVPIIIDESGLLIAGHARLVAAQALGLAKVPCVRRLDLTDAQKRALSIADNRIAELAEWEPDALQAEFAALCELEFPVELTGFETAEIDSILEFGTTEAEGTDTADSSAEPSRSEPAVSEMGDLWELSNHRLLCGDALLKTSYMRVLGQDLAAMVITDSPYNVPIRGHVSGLGKVKHREFAMASGEMSRPEFTTLLSTTMKLLVQFSADGSLHYHCMDHRHVGEIAAAGEIAYTERKNICVWVKPNGGMGSLYRSRHELVFVFKNGSAPHQNNIQLGKHGRYRTNVWEYAGANSFGRTRDADLAAHPTVKPIAMIADAIRDCTKRGDIVLDPFAGSGTILLAAERTGRRAAAIELDAHYVDTAIRRWELATGGRATLVETGESFGDVAKRRSTTAHPEVSQTPVSNVRD